MGTPWYCTREDVKSALDFKTTTPADAQVDRAIEAASRSVEGYLHRRFYPWTGTRYFDWPNRQYAASYRLWLESNELVSVTALTSGGTTISPSDYVLRRADGLDEAPYDHIELLTSSSATFGGGSTHQRDIAITGVYGWLDERSVEDLIGNVTDTATTVVLHDPVSVGVGSLIRIGDERMIVTGRSARLQAHDLAADLTASNSNTTFAVDSGSHFHAGEVILIDGERMLVVDVAGDTLTVRRAWDGSTLAAHTSGAVIYRYNSFTVERGVLGTTATAHLSDVPVYVHRPPGPVKALCVAEAVSTVLNESAGYARTAGSGENAREAAGRSLSDARTRARIACGRMGRIGAV